MLLSGHDLRWSAALALVLAVQAGWFAASTSGTLDETAYLRNGFSIYRHGDFSGLPGDGIAPLSVLLSMAAPAALDVRGYAMPFASRGPVPSRSSAFRSCC